MTENKSPSKSLNSKKPGKEANAEFAKAQEIDQKITVVEKQVVEQEAKITRLPSKLT